MSKKLCKERLIDFAKRRISIGPGGGAEFKIEDAQCSDENKIAVRCSCIGYDFIKEKGVARCRDLLRSDAGLAMFCATAASSEVFFAFRHNYQVEDAFAHELDVAVNIRLSIPPVCFHDGSYEKDDDGNIVYAWPSDLPKESSSQMFR